MHHCKPNRPLAQTITSDIIYNPGKMDIIGHHCSDDYKGRKDEESGRVVQVNLFIGINCKLWEMLLLGKYSQMRGSFLGAFSSRGDRRAHVVAENSSLSLRRKVPRIQSVQCLCFGPPNPRWQSLQSKSHTFQQKPHWIQGPEIASRSSSTVTDHGKQFDPVAPLRHLFTCKKRESRQNENVMNDALSPPEGSSIFSPSWRLPARSFSPGSSILGYSLHCTQHRGGVQLYRCLPVNSKNKNTKQNSFK